MGANRIQKGPLNATATNPLDTVAIVQDQQNNTLSISGDTHKLTTLQELIAVIGPQLALTTITTAQTLLSTANLSPARFNAGELNVAGRTLLVSGSLVYSTTGGNVATITLELTLGGVTLCTITTAATNTAASTNLPVQFQFELNVAATGVNGILQTHGQVNANIGTTAAAAIATYLDTNVDGALTITVGTNPANGDTITINGTVVTFTSGTATGNQVKIGGSAALTATALYSMLAASTDANIALSTWTNPSSGVVTGTAIAAGFVPAASTSVTAKITLSNTTVNLTAADTLTVAIAGSGSGLLAAQLNNAMIELVG
jgi:hypothetical protein